MSEQPNNIIDYLDEDPVIPSQQYFILSYILPGPKNELQTPMIKIRGCYKTKSECESKIKKLQQIDKMFNMFVVDVGKWGSLLTDEQIEKDTEIDVKYRDSRLNEIFKNIKEEKLKEEQEELKRIEFAKKKTEIESSKIFQNYLAFLNTCNYKFPQNIKSEYFDFYINDKIANPEDYIEYAKNLRSHSCKEFSIYENAHKKEEKDSDILNIFEKISQEKLEKIINTLPDCNMLGINKTLQEYGKSRLFNCLSDGNRTILYEAVHQALQADILENLLKQINETFFEFMKK